MFPFKLIFFSKYICILNYFSFKIKKIEFYVSLKSVGDFQSVEGGGWIAPPPYWKCLAYTFYTIYY